MFPYVEIYSLCCLSVELPSFAHIFFSFVSLSFILAKCLIRLKSITREFWKFDYSEIYFVLTKKSMLSVIWWGGGMKTKDLVGVCEHEIGTPLASVGMSLAQN